MEHILSVICYGLVLLYGAMLSVQFTSGRASKQELRITVIVVCVLLCAQTIFAMLFGFTAAKQFYPLISHLPLALMMIFLLKKEVGTTIVSILVAYFLCQLPRWVGAIALYLFHSGTIQECIYMVSLILFYLLLRKYFTEPAYHAMSYSGKSRILFGVLPLFYYVFDYTTTVYTNMLYQGVKMVVEFLPAAMSFFYFLFLVMYHREVQKRNTIELNNALLSMQLDQAANDLHNAKATQEMSRIYRHDLRHHFSLLYAYAENGELDKIKEYLIQSQKELDKITPIVFCENEMVNLIVSTFAVKAKKLGVNLSTKISLPNQDFLPDTELCSIISNGLENAITAASHVSDRSLRKVNLECSIKQNKLVLMIQNIYLKKIQFKDTLPTSVIEGHGFGCRSIRTIVENRGGLASFDANGNVFTLKVILPI